MTMMTFQTIQQATAGDLLSGKAPQKIGGISTDTRTLKKRDLYVALKGPNFDGHDFIAEAIRKGASGILISQMPPSLPPDMGLIRVADTLKSLGDLAHAYRKQFDLPVIAITGSCGKTTTKDLLASCLQGRAPVSKTVGNLNNLIGLPLTIFGLNKAHQYAVWELGMNAFGEIARLTLIAEPTMGMITNVGLAHLEGVGDIKGVARAKGELFAGMAKGSLAFVNLDDPYIQKMPTPANRLTYGFSTHADICCTRHENRSKGDRNGMRIFLRTKACQAEFWVPLTGRHHAQNVTACYAVCTELGLTTGEIQKGLDAFQLPAGRGRSMVLKEGIIVVDETYNSNPSSLYECLQSVATSYADRRKIAVLGEMFELGDQAAALHYRAGEQVADCKYDLLLAFGEHAEETKKGFLKKSSCAAQAFTDKAKLNMALKNQLQKNDVVLVKGSRGVRMEDVVNFLQAN